MVRVILSEDEFLASVKIGDRFWFMTTVLYGQPDSIKGPVFLLAIKKDDSSGRLKAAFRVSKRGQKEEFIEYLVDKRCGVFLSEEDAKSYFEERKNAYETDPKLIAETERLIAEEEVYYREEEEDRREREDWDDFLRRESDLLLDECYGEDE